MKFFVAVFILASGLSAHADVWSRLSEGSAQLWGAQDCGGENEDKARAAIAQSRHCVLADESTNENLENLRDLQSHVQGSAEDGFFATLALQHAKELECSADFASAVASTSKESRDSIASKIVILREARRRLASASLERARNSKACPLSMEDLKPSQPMVDLLGRDPDYELCKEILVSRAAYETTLRAIPLSGAPEVRSLLDKYTDLEEGPELESLQNQLDAKIAQAYKNTLSSIRQSAQNLTELGKEDGQNIDRSTRYALMSDPQVVQKVIAGGGPENKDLLLGVACRADQRFYSGADALERNLMIASFLFAGGAGLTVRLGAHAAKVAAGANGARASGLMSLNAARVIEYSATGLAAGAGALQAYSQIDRQCLSQVRGTPSAQSCVSAPQIQQLAQDDCILGVGLAAIGFVPVVPGLVRGGQMTVQSLAAQVRINKATNVLARPLSTAQKNAVLSAHEVGAGELGRNGELAAIGNYTQAQLRQKARILRDAGFDPRETRLLMENGVVGTATSSQSLMATVLPSAWPIKTQGDFDRALKQAKEARDVGVRRFDQQHAPKITIEDLQSALASHAGLRGEQLVPTVTYTSGKVVMTYQGPLGKKYLIQLNASNQQYYYTITESINGMNPVYLQAVPKSGGAGWGGLRTCQDMAACHYAAAGF